MTVFDDRSDAGSLLATALKEYGNDNPLILAIPRGALPIGRKVAEALQGDLDVVLVRKLGAPGNPEFAVGAIGESGKVFVAEYAERVGADSHYLAQEAALQLETIRRRRAQFNQVHTTISPRGRTVIVVDDGLATGLTMCAALQEVRAQHPAKLICAVPVTSPDAAERVRPLCDKLVCLAVEENFGGVGQFYQDFRQVTDEEAIAILRS
jgi:predicted phosphoribosyltransferase